MRSSIRSNSASLLLVALLLAPGLAHGNALEDAKQAAKQAATHYNLGRFTDAADAYAKSYELVPTAGLLFNLGQCQMMLKDYAKAIFFFEGYLRDKPDAPNAALVRDLMAEAKREQAAEQAHKDAAAAAALQAVPPPPPPQPPPPPRRDRRRLPAVVLGASSIALVGAAAYLGQHADLEGGLSRLAPAGSSQRASFDTGHRDYVIAAAVVGGVGAVAAITSGVLGYLGWAKTRAPNVALAPLVGGGAAMISGSF